MPGEGDFAPLADTAPVLYRYPTYAGDEFCEIEWGDLWGKVGGFLSTRCNHAFFAMAFGPKGIECVDELLWIDRRIAVEPRIYYPSPEGVDYRYGAAVLTPKSDSDQTVTNYRQMIADLEAKGWVKQKERGPNWWQARFVRRN